MNENENKREKELMQLAKERIEVKNSLRTHIVAYVIVNLFLVFIWFVSDTEFFAYHVEFITDFNFWPIWPILGWGIGLAFHVVDTINHLSSSNNERIQKEYEILKSRDNK